jgi:hypothetical protein
MTQARTSHTATSLADGRVLIAGGFSGWPGQDSSSAELFDPESRTFTTAGRMTSQRSGHTAVRLADGRILLVGGTDDNGNALASAEIYDPRAGTSVATGSMANGRYKAVTIGFQDGRVAIVGGGDVGPGTPAPTSTVEYFDPVSGRFEPGPLVPVLERADADAVLLEDGRLFISGGHDLGDAPYGDAEIFGAAAIYDPLSGDVEAIPLRGAGLIHENAGTYVAGAVRVADGRVLVAVDLPDQEGWSLVFVDSRTRATMPGGRLAGYPIAGLTTMHDGRVLILTSQRADCGNVEASVFNPRTMVLEHVGRIPDLGTCNGPGHPSVTSLDDGLVLIAGGKASGGTTASAASLIRAVLGQ